MSKRYLDRSPDAAGKDYMYFCSWNLHSHERMCSIAELYKELLRCDDDKLIMALRIRQYFVIRSKRE